MRDVQGILAGTAAVIWGAWKLGEAVRILYRPFELRAALEDQPATKVLKPIVTTESFDDVGRSPKVPLVSWLYRHASGTV